jgi:hypothetical protein
VKKILADVLPQDEEVGEDTTIRMTFNFESMSFILE